MPKQNKPDILPKNALQGVSRFVDKTDKLENRFRQFLFRVRMPIFFIAVTVVALIARVAFYEFVSGDFHWALDPWLNELRDYGGFNALVIPFGNYTSPYQYLMAAMTYIPGLDNLMVVKIPSITADFVLAASCAWFVWIFTKSKWRSAISYALLLILPSVLLNSSAWGQCDAMYTTILVLFLCMFFKKKTGLALFLYGFALAIKIQAVFVMPAVLFLWLCGKLRIRHLLATALGYFVAFVPAMIVKGDLSPLWYAYTMQTNTVNETLHANIPNGVTFFTGFEGGNLEMISTALIMICIILLGATAMYCWQKKDAFTNESMFVLIAFIGLLVPFILPAMRDRYFFSIEVFSLLYAVIRPSRFYLPVLMQLGILPHYMFYLEAAENRFAPWNVFLILAVLVVLFWDLVQHLSKTTAVHTIDIPIEPLE